YVRHWHDFQAHAGMFFRQGAHEGGQEFLAIAAHWTSGNLQVYMGKKEPGNDGPEPDESQETGDDHQTPMPSVIQHRSAPFIASSHSGHNAHHSMYHNTANSDILSTRYSPTLGLGRPSPPTMAPSNNADRAIPPSTPGSGKPINPRKAPCAIT